MTWSRALAIAAALLMGAPGLAASASGDIIWVELCDAGHPGGRIPLLVRRDGDDSPANACHAACGLKPERRPLPTRR
jgi:hypothetical protein